MIDFHCHIDLYEDPNRIVEIAKSHNMYVLAVTTTPLAWRGTKKIVANVDRVKVALGFHPQLVATRYNEIDEFFKILPQTKYVGEIGIDATKDYKSSVNLQKEIFKHILNSSTKLGGRILSIHSRCAVKIVLDELEMNSDVGIPVLHWFSGTQKELERAIKIGCWFSVGPTMLSSRKGLELVARIPQNKILTETDGPFTQNNGKILVPADVSIAINDLSSVWHMTGQQVNEQINNNFRRLIKSMHEA